MNEKEIQKRMNATVDILTWLDQRIAQQVEHYGEQLQREHVKASVEELRQELLDRVTADRNRVVDAVSQRVVDVVKRIIDEDVVKRIINEGVGRVFDRVDAKLAELDQRLAASMRRFDDDDGQPPPLKH